MDMKNILYNVVIATVDEIIVKNSEFNQHVLDNF